MIIANRILVYYKERSITRSHILKQGKCLALVVAARDVEQLLVRSHLGVQVDEEVGHRVQLAEARTSRL